MLHSGSRVRVFCTATRYGRTVRGSLPSVKRLGFQFDHLPPSSTDVKNEWSLTSVPLYAFVAWTVTNFPVMYHFIKNLDKDAS